MPIEVIKLTAPAEDTFDIAPSDANPLDYKTRGLYIGGTGDVRVLMISGSDITFVALAAGIIHPIQIIQVFATGTTATNILGLR